MLKGFLIGNYTDADKKTGVTAILCPQGAIGGVSVRGGAPATHETDLLPTMISLVTAISGMRERANPTFRR